MVGKMRNANNLTAVALYAYNCLKNAVSIELRNRMGVRKRTGD